MRRGVIAVGSNSTRLLIADCGGKRPETVCRARRGTRLLMRVENGVITPEGIRHATEDIAALYAEARARGAESIELIATSATREAKNADAFAGSVRRATGLSLRVLSGEEEAYLACLAVSGEAGGVVIDIGGGSTEITAGEGGAVVMNESVPVGSSRLLVEFGEIRSVEQALAVRAAALERLRGLTDRAGALSGRALYAIGGTAVAAAGILTLGGSAEGVCLTRDEIDRLLRLIAPMSCDERAALPGLPASRASHMPHGLCVLSAVMGALKAERLTVSERTNMDGLLLVPAAPSV